MREFTNMFKKLFSGKGFFRKKNKLKLSLNKINNRLVQIEYQQKYNDLNARLEEHKNLHLKYMSNEPILTFCMPTYNGQGHVARALESILMQETTYKYKIWVIDDCSTDNTAKVVREYEKLYPEIIKLDVNEKNEGGLTMAPKIFNTVKTKYWMNFDQDDYWISKDKLQRSVDFFEIHPEFTLVASNLLIKSSNNLDPAYDGDKPNIKFDFVDYPLPMNILLQTSSAMFRNVFTKEDLERINSYVGTEKQHCILGDTFRNVFALSKGRGYYENSLDSVYNWTETGTWSKLNVGQQDFYNLQYFYDSIDFFDNPKYKKQMKYVSGYYLKKVLRNVNLLNGKELEEFKSIKKGLSNAKTNTF